MSTIGLIGLIVAFAGVAVSVIAFLAGYVLERIGKRDTAETAS